MTLWRFWCMVGFKRMIITRAKEGVLDRKDMSTSRDVSTGCKYYQRAEK